MQNTLFLENSFPPSIGTEKGVRSLKIEVSTAGFNLSGQIRGRREDRLSEADEEEPKEEG